MDSAMGLGIVLSLKDLASEGLEKVRQRLASFSTASKDMLKEFDEGVRGMLGGFASVVAGTKIFGAFNNIFGSSLNTAMDFEQAMARVGAVSGAVGEDFAALTKQARDLGRDTQYSATQAANSQELLARAGFKTNEIISAMPRLLNMASAEGMDLANAADIASSALRGFGMEAEEINRVADVLAKSSSASNTSIALLGESLKYVAPVASGLGFSIEHTNALLGAMANAGVKGSMAGTSLKAAFLKLAQEPKSVAKALAELGVSGKDTEGNLKQLPELMKELATTMAGMGRGDKLGYLSNIFGSQAAAGMLALMDSVADGTLSQLEQDLYNCSGAAKAMSDRMNATAQGAMKRLESASEGLRIAIGNHLIPVYTWAIDKFAEFKSWLTQMIEAHPILTKTVIALAGTLTALAGSVMIVTGAMSALSGLMKVWPLMKTGAVLALKSIRANAIASAVSLKAMALPVLGLVALAGTLYAAWRTNFAGIRDMVRAVTEGFNMAVNASKEGIAEVDEALYEELQKAGILDFAVIMGSVFFRIRQLWEGFCEGFMEGVGYINTAFNVFKDIFTPVLEGGKELLLFLGILKPVTDTQAKTWRAWGQLFGRLVPIILSVIAAFKGFSIVTGIIKNVAGALSLITAHPIIAAITAVIAVLIYLYAHWEEVKESFKSGIKSIASAILSFPNNAEKFVQSCLEKISNFFGKVVDDIRNGFNNAVKWVKKQWQGFIDWWDSWTLADVFVPVVAWASGIKDRTLQLWQGFKNWWNSWTITDIFTPVVEFAVNIKNKILDIWQGFKDWWGNLSLSDIFAFLAAPALIAKDTVLGIWQGFSDWWNSWTLADIFAPVSGFAESVKNNALEKWQEFQNWWDSWTIGDVFSSVADSLLNVIAICKNAWNKFKDWFTSWIPSFSSEKIEQAIAPVPEVGEQNYNQYKKTLEGRGYVFNADDTVKKLPADLLMSDMMAQQLMTQQAEEQLKKLREVSIPEIPAQAQPVQPPVMPAMKYSNMLMPTPELPAPVQPKAQEAPAAGLLLQQAQNAAAMNVQAQTQALQASPVDVKNQVDVKVESKPVILTLDGDKIGECALRWAVQQNVREGMGD